MPDEDPYVTDLDDYEGPVERISPYHFYMHRYWNLRGKWRKLLYDWTRREPCDATATIEPQQTIAGQRYTFTITVQVGDTPLGPGARIAVYFPLHFGGDKWRRAMMMWQGPDGRTGYGSRIIATSARPDVGLATRVHSTGTVFTCVEALLETGSLERADIVELVIGDPSCKRPIASEQAKSFPFRVAIDHAGDDTFRPIVPNPTVRNVGGRARYFRCFAPAAPQPGEPFDVRVVAADLAHHNPSHHYGGRVELEAPDGGIGGTPEVEVAEEEHGSTGIQGVTVAGDGPTAVLVADREKGLMGRTNPICPGAAPDGLSLYYGEIHSHTELSDGGGLPEDSLRWARDVEGLDFSALADHFEDGQSYNYTLEDKWSITKERIEEFHDPGRFVTLLGYEIGTLEQHRNVYFADGDGRMIVEGRGGERITMDNVFQKLAGTDYILIPHAPKFHGINWHRPHDPERQRLVEIFSYWGDSEKGGPKSVRHALDLGYRLGFTGGTDNHQSEPGNPDIGGITGVWTPELTRRAIFDALLARRTFATSGPRMILTFHVNDTLMGDELTAPDDGPRRIRARAIAGESIDHVEIIRNGEVVHSAPGAGADVTLEWEDTDPLEELLVPREIGGGRSVYYYLRAETVNGELGWASPVWVERE